MKITTAMRMEQERLHALGHYGVMGETYAPLVSQIVNKLGVTELLDYGCGKHTSLAKNLRADHKLTIQCYDPGVPEFAGDPVPMQMVTCIDVLEHVEPECLEEVLDDLKRCTQVVGFFTVTTVPASKTLSDGRNAHLIVEPMEFWLPKLMYRFEIQTVQRVQNGFYAIVYTLPEMLIKPETVQ